MPGIPAGQALRAFAHALPKVELHVHLVGSASLPTVLDLARRRPAAGVPTDERELAEFFTFRDFAHFPTVYLAVTSLVRDRHDVHTLVAGLETGRARAAELGVELAWCFDIPGEKGVKAGRETLVFALRERPEGLVSFGLGGPEPGVGRVLFEPFFTRAREAGLHSVPHAGETTGPATIWSALHDLGAERIGHGTSCAADPALLEHLAAHRIPLEVCPTSNVRTGQVPSVAAHPVRRMLDHGVVVTLNTDDPPMFGATLTGEYVAVAETLGLTAAELVRLAENAVDASFLDERRKALLRTEITEMTLPDTGIFA
ncbi:adenosine deaminase family protein [Amycolatopsis sp. MEPSY49]|uniref:adenosine deaminase family protein n=1 Tax=Amycolatopsis sp. MEPSY49 TaxID=3151600 RepID=UPI003EF8A5E5